jgi:phosphoglycolate phosphatase
MPNFILDLDGTMVDSSAEVIGCLKQAFKDVGYAVDDSVWSSDLIGPPLKKIVEKVAPQLKDESIVKSIIACYRKRYDFNEEDATQLYDGVLAFLKHAHDRGSKLFVATFKPTAPTMRILKSLDVAKFFDDVYSIDKFGQAITKSQMINDIVEKYKLDKDDTIMIGDAESDIAAAKEAGVKSVGVLWGYGTDKTFIKQNADFVINKMDELKCLE